MDFNIEVRKKQLQSLDQYISSSKDKVQSILDCLGWSTEKVKSAEEQVICSFNKSHRIDPKNAVEHVKNCQIKKEGYNFDETFLSEPLNHAVQSITIDPFIKIQVLNKARSEDPAFAVAWNGIDPDPRTSDRLFSTFSSHERLALYDFCVQHTKGPPVPPEIQMLSTEDTQDNKTLSEGELRALERDAKRRQVKYKSVHTNHKTYTEEMKQVIENQMAIYEDWIKRSQEITARSDCETKCIEQRLHSPTEETKRQKIQNRSDYRVRDNNKDHSFSNSSHDKDDTYRNSDSKPSIESMDYEQSYAKYKRCRSPSEYSNTSSNKSRRKDIDDKHSRSSRHSSLDSLRSSYKHSEEKHKVREHHKERDIGYRKHYDEKYGNYYKDERGDRRYRQIDRKSEKSLEIQNTKSAKHKSDEKQKERNGREDSEYDRCRKGSKYQHDYEKTDNRYERDSRTNDRYLREREYKKYRDDKDRSKHKPERSDYCLKIHENEDKYLQRKRLAPSYDSRNGKSLSRDKS